MSAPIGRNPKPQVNSQPTVLGSTIKQEIDRLAFILKKLPQNSELHSGILAKRASLKEMYKQIKSLKPGDLNQSALTVRKCFRLLKTSLKQVDGTQITQDLSSRAHSPQSTTMLANQLTLAQAEEELLLFQTHLDNKTEHSSAIFSNSDLKVEREFLLKLRKRLGALQNSGEFKVQIESLDRRVNEALQLIDTRRGLGRENLDLITDMSSSLYPIINPEDPLSTENVNFHSAELRAILASAARMDRAKESLGITHDTWKKKACAAVDKVLESYPLELEKYNQGLLKCTRSLHRLKAALNKAKSPPPFKLILEHAEAKEELSRFVAELEDMVSLLDEMAQAPLVVEDGMERSLMLALKKESSNDKHITFYELGSSIPGLMEAKDFLKLFTIEKPENPLVQVKEGLQSFETHFQAKITRLGKDSSRDEFEKESTFLLKLANTLHSITNPDVSVSALEQKIVAYQDKIDLQIDHWDAVDKLANDFHANLSLLNEQMSACESGRPYFDSASFRAIIDMSGRMDRSKDTLGESHAIWSKLALSDLSAGLDSYFEALDVEFTEALHVFESAQKALESTKSPPSFELIQEYAKARKILELLLSELLDMSSFQAELVQYSPEADGMEEALCNALLQAQTRTLGPERWNFGLFSIGGQTLTQVIEEIDECLSNASSSTLKDLNYSDSISSLLDTLKSKVPAPSFWTYRTELCVLDLVAPISNELQHEISTTLQHKSDELSRDLDLIESLPSKLDELHFLLNNIRKGEAQLQPTKIFDTLTALAKTELECEKLLHKYAAEPQLIQSLTLHQRAYQHHQQQELALFLDGFCRKLNIVIKKTASSLQKSSKLILDQKSKNPLEEFAKYTQEIKAFTELRECLLQFKTALSHIDTSELHSPVLLTLCSENPTFSKILGLLPRDDLNFSDAQTTLLSALVSDKYQKHDPVVWAKVKIQQLIKQNASYPKCLHALEIFSFVDQHKHLLNSGQSSRLLEALQLSAEFLATEELKLQQVVEKTAGQGIQEAPSPQRLLSDSPFEMDSEIRGYLRGASTAKTSAYQGYQKSVKRKESAYRASHPDTVQRIQVLLLLQYTGTRVAAVHGFFENKTLPQKLGSSLVTSRSDMSLSQKQWQAIQTSSTERVPALPNWLKILIPPIVDRALVQPSTEWTRVFLQGEDESIEQQILSDSLSLQADIEHLESVSSALSRRLLDRKELDVHIQLPGGELSSSEALRQIRNYANYTKEQLHSAMDLHAQEQTPEDLDLPHTDLKNLRWKEYLRATGLELQTASLAASVIQDELEQFEHKQAETYIALEDLSALSGHLQSDFGLAHDLLPSAAQLFLKNDRGVDLLRLLPKGLDPNSKIEGRLLLDTAVASASHRCVNILLAAGAVGDPMQIAQTAVKQRWMDTLELIKGDLAIVSFVEIFISQNSDHLLPQFFELIQESKISQQNVIKLLSAEKFTTLHTLSELGFDLIPYTDQILRRINLSPSPKALVLGRQLTGPLDLGEGIRKGKNLYRKIRKQKSSKADVSEMAAALPKHSDLKLRNLPHSQLIMEASSYIEAYQEALGSDQCPEDPLALEAIKRMEIVARQRMSLGFVEDAFSIRHQIASLVQYPEGQLFAGGLLSAVDELSERIGFVDLGYYLADMDTDDIKSGHLHLTLKTIANIPHLECELKTSYLTRGFARGGHPEAPNGPIQEIVDLINKNPEKVSQWLRDNGLSDGVKVTHDDLHFLRKIGDRDYEQTDVGLDSSTGACFSFSGLGDVTIGMGRTRSSVQNRMTVRVPITGSESEVQEKLLQLLAIMGLGSALRTSSADSIMRRKIAVLAHEFAPSQAYNLEQNTDYFQMTPEQMREAVITAAPFMQPHFKRYLDSSNPQDRMTLKEVSRGYQEYSFPGLAKELYQQGARAIFGGITTGSTPDSIRSAVLVLKSGFLSTETRYSAGLIIPGASSAHNIGMNGADVVFTRTLIESEVPYPIRDIHLFGQVALIVSLDALERPTYQYPNDGYWGRRTGLQYQSRLNKEEHFKRIDVLETEGRKGWYGKTDEILFRNRIKPNLIVGMVISGSPLEAEQHYESYLQILRDEEVVELIDGEEVINGIPLRQFVRVSTELTDELARPAYQQFLED